MHRSELVPVQVYEMLMVYKLLDEQLVMKFCYQSISDFQAVRDAIDHVNTISERLDIVVASLEVFCVDLGFRGLDPEEPDLLINKCDRQIYDTDDLDTSLIEELPLRMEEKVTRWNVDQDLSCGDLLDDQIQETSRWVTRSLEIQKPVALYMSAVITVQLIVLAVGCVLVRVTVVGPWAVTSFGFGCMAFITVPGPVLTVICVVKLERIFDRAMLPRLKPIPPEMLVKSDTKSSPVELDL